MRVVKTFAVALLLVFAAFANPRSASAGPLNFSCISDNSPTDCGTLESQLQLNVFGLLNLVNFKFDNIGPSASSITDIYFDDSNPPLLYGTAIISNGTGVKFVTGCSPGDLPGGGSAGFVSDYCAESSSKGGTQTNGVNPYESLTLSFLLTPGSTLSQLVTALESGAFMVGIKVQGFTGGGSETGIACVDCAPGTPGAPVPEPASLLLLGTGMFLLARQVRRRPRPPVKSSN